MALVEEARLVRVCLGGQGHNHRGRVQPLLQTADESGIRLPVRPGDVLEVHIQPLVALLGHGLLHLIDQRLLEGEVREHHLRPLAGEGVLLCEGGQVHQRPRTQPGRLLQDHAVPQVQQTPLGSDAVGKRGDIAHIRELGAQKLPGDEGVGVAVGVGAPQLLSLVGDHQPLPGPDEGLSPQAVIAAVEGAEAHAIGAGDGVQGLPRLDHMEGLHPLDHQGLSHRQGPVLRYTVLLRQESRLHAVTPRDGIKGLPGPDHMDFHLHIPPDLHIFIGYAPRTVPMLRKILSFPRRIGGRLFRKDVI